MKKKISLYIVFNDTEEGNAEKNSFKSLCDTELAKPSIVHSINYKDIVLTSFVNLEGQAISLQLFYNNDLDAESFWEVCKNEYAKSMIDKTIYNTQMSTNGQKHDCKYDENSECINSQTL